MALETAFQEPEQPVAQKVYRMWTRGNCIGVNASNQATSLNFDSLYISVSQWLIRTYLHFSMLQMLHLLHRADQ